MVEDMPEQGEVLFVDFEPHKGHEASKYRPAVVTSANDFNARSSTVVVCPVVTTDNGHPFHVRVELENVSGFACAEQVRAMNLHARKHKHVGYLAPDEMNAILDRIGGVFGI